MAKNFIFSSESVGEGHPDKVADYISDSILDACLEQDPNSRVACETLVKSNRVFLAGEISTKAKINYEAITRDAIRETGYTFEGSQFHADSVFISNNITVQSPEIAEGVDTGGQKQGEEKELGAGDQGIMFGFACKDTPELMPAPVLFAHKINQRLAELRKSTAPWLRPDCKSQVAATYEDYKLTGIKNIVISTQHAPEISQDEIRKFCLDEVIHQVIPTKMLKDDTEYLINPSGSFVVGGPEADAGLTGRKIIVDTYGGWSRHGGGAFSGKDATKVDRSAAYYCRWVAKNIVAAGIADQVEIQVAYAIGYPYPTSIHLSTFGGSQYRDRDIRDAIQKVFTFKPSSIIKELDLLRPIYRDTTHYGHFTKSHLPWEQTDKVAELCRAMDIPVPEGVETTC